MINKELEIIKRQFNDERVLEFLSQNDDNGKVFLTDDLEIISFNYHIGVFTAEDLAGMVRIAEELYKIHNKRINVYVLMFGGEVTVKEHDIKSEADFTIKLAVCNDDPCRVLFDGILARFENGCIGDGDLEVLEMLPLLCNDNERDFYREQYFKIMSEV